jgi:arylsulfatase A-like enzyme
MGNTTPDIFFVVFDSLRKDHVGAYGNKWIKTPNLDAFSREAVTFTRCYPESLPTIPFRRSLFTGARTYPFRDHKTYKGIGETAPAGWGPVPEKQNTLPEMLAGHGYRSDFITDTWHYFKPSNNFHRGFGAWRWVRGHEGDFYKTGPPVSDEEALKHISTIDKNEDLVSFIKGYLVNNLHRVKEEEQTSAQVFREGANWLSANIDAENLFMVLDSFCPHEPWKPPVAYRMLYDRNESVADLIQPPYAHWKGLMTEDELKRLQANYAGMVTFVDKWFGVFIESLKTIGRWDRSLVVVLSDHGHSLGIDPGDNGFVGKCSHPMTRGVADLVLMIKPPFVKGPGTVCDQLIYNHDVSKTVLSLAGIELPEQMEGIDFWPHIDDKNKKTREYVVFAWGTVVTAITDDWWYNGNIWGDGALLFRLKDDPYLQNNLAGKHPEVCRKMLDYAVADAGGKIPDYFDKFRATRGSTLFKFADFPYETARKNALRNRAP